MDHGLGEILSNFGMGAVVCLLVDSSVAGCLWWFQISGFIPVDLDLWVSSCGSGYLKPFP